ELEQELVFDLLELARIDLVALVAVRPGEAEELVLTAELRRQELVDERHVAVERAHLENLSPPEPETQIPMLLRLERIALFPLAPELPLVPAVLDVPEELHAELVRVQPALRRREHARVVIERDLLSPESEADALGEARSRRAHHVHVPAAVFLAAPPAQDAEVQEDERHFRCEGIARRAEDEALRARVAVAIEIRPQK